MQMMFALNRDRLVAPVEQRHFSQSLPGVVGGAIAARAGGARRQLFARAT